MKATRKTPEPARLLSIQVGLPRRHGTEGAADPLERAFRSAIVKSPVAGPVHLGRINLEGDAQADRRVHGGPDMAVLVYSADHYPSWRAELDRPDLAYGAFGENFTVAGQDETTVCLGDVYVLGEVRVQVSKPRGPCFKLARRFGLQDMPARVLAAARTGWYLRVLQEGTVEAGMTLVLLERPLPGRTIFEAVRERFG